MKQLENNLQMSNELGLFTNNGDIIEEKYIYYKTGKFPCMHVLYVDSELDLIKILPFNNEEFIKGLNIDLQFDILYISSNKSLYKVSCQQQEIDENKISTILLYNDCIMLKLASNKITVYYNLDIFSNEQIIDFTDALYNKLPKVKDENKTAKVQLVTYSNYYETIESEIKTTTVDIKKNYNDDFLPVYNKLVDFIHQRESGIALLSSPPGTGKTYLLRHLITHEPTNYLFITPSVAMSMGNPDFVGFLMDNKNSIFVMEDCEQLLQERVTNNWSTSLANILNMTDGILSDIFNIKFICTFNAPETTIDPALLREGRCFVNYKFDKLKADKVAVLNKENNLGIPEDEICDMTLAELYNYKGKKEVKKKIGF